MTTLKINKSNILEIVLTASEGCQWRKIYSLITSVSHFASSSCSCSCMVPPWSSCVCHRCHPEVRCFPVEWTEVKANLVHYFILSCTLHHSGLNALECITSDTYSLQQSKICQLQILVLHECVFSNVNAYQFCTVRHSQSTTSTIQSTSHDHHSLQRFQSIQF